MYSFTPAGANATVAEVLAAIKTMLDTESAGVGLWMANAYDAANGWLEIRRKGSPAGTLGSFRALMFGGTSPNAAALAYTISASNVQLYCGIAQSASTTGPDADYDTASPYNAGKLWTGGSIITSPASTIAKSRNPYVSLIESDEACAILVGDGQQTSATIFGALVEQITGSAAWVVFNSGGYNGAGGNVNYSSWSSTQGYIPGHAVSGSTQGMGLWHDGVNRRWIVRHTTTFGADDFFLNANTAGLSPIDLMSKIGESGTYTYSLMGVARQLKFGPLQQNRIVLRDGSDVVQAIALAHGLSFTGGPLWFDQVA